MNDVARIPPAQAASLKPNQIFLKGRIDRVSKYEDRFTHICVLPAPDAYSKPALVEVESRSRLGSSSEDIAVVCSWNGWSNNYKGRDGETVYGVRGKFVVVE